MIGRRSNDDRGDDAALVEPAGIDHDGAVADDEERNDGEPVVDGEPVAQAEEPVDHDGVPRTADQADLDGREAPAGERDGARPNDDGPGGGESRRATTVAGSGALTLVDVGKRFGDQWVLRDLNLDVAPGTIVGLIGPSGCGKTTTVRMATGVLRPDEGEVRLLGREPTALSQDDRVHLGYLPQEPVLFDELSLWENLTFHASLNGVRLLRRRRHLKELLEMVELRDDRRKLVRQASGGMKRRLALAASLVHDPAFILLDEPTAGIDPVLRRTLWDHFRQLRDDGRTLVVTTQYVGEATHCDVVVLLAEGRVAACGTPDDLRRLAVGGDLVQIETRDQVDYATAARIRDLPQVRDLNLTSPNRLRLTVDDGGSALVAVLHELEAAGIEVLDSEEVVIDYDEVFIRLVDRPAEEVPV